MKRKMIGRLLLGGCAVGTVNGLLGGGGGMICVPLLNICGMEARRAHATAIAVILPASLISGVVYLFGGSVSLFLLVPVLAGVCIGGFGGAKLLGSLPTVAVETIFALLMLICGIRMAV